MKLRRYSKLTAVFIAVMALVLQGSSALAMGGWPKYKQNDGFQAWDSYHEFWQGSLSGGAKIGNHHGKPVVTLWPGAQHGAWESPTVPLSDEIGSINPSWQANTPLGSHVSMQLKVQSGDQWSDWYKMGEWTFENTDGIERTSVDGQSDDFGGVYVDTFIAFTDINAYRLKVQLHSGDGSSRPKVYQLAAQAASWREFDQVSQTTMTEQVDLDVPRYSQYDHTGEFPQYGSGGEAWCSPTSTAMVMQYYNKGPSAADIAALPSDPVFDSNGRDDGEVTHAALYTYDAAYEGTGNWPFNTAYAAHYGLDTAVRVFDSLTSIERMIKKGNPAVVSISWDNEDDDPDNDLPGAGIQSTPGHLMVVRGFTADGDVIANDPATHGGDSDVRRVYDREAFERQWINASNGTAYTFKD